MLKAVMLFMSRIIVKKRNKFHKIYLGSFKENCEYIYIYYYDKCKLLILCNYIFKICQMK